MEARSDHDPGTAMNHRYDLPYELLEPCRLIPAGQFSQLSADMFARARDESDALVREAGLATDPRVRWDDVVIGRNDDRQGIPIRVYRPSGRNRATAALVYLHGGAFCFGSPQHEHGRALRIAAELGIVVLSVKYRLAPEHRFPAGLDDAFDALLWVADNSLELDIDPSRIAVGGASAGGCLAAGLAIRARDRSGPVVAGQMLIYPVLDDRLSTASMNNFDDAPIFSPADCRHMWKIYLGEGRVAIPAECAPARAANLEGLPPACIIAAEYDPLRDEAIDYAARLLRIGVSVELHCVARAVHGFDVLAAGPLANAGSALVIAGLQRLLRLA